MVLIELFCCNEINRILTKLQTLPIWHTREAKIYSIQIVFERCKVVFEPRSACYSQPERERDKFGKWVLKIPEVPIVSPSLKKGGETDDSACW